MWAFKPLYLNILHFFPLHFQNKFKFFIVMNQSSKYHKHMEFYVNKSIFFWRVSKSVIFILFLFLFILYCLEYMERKDLLPFSYFFPFLPIVLIYLGKIYGFVFCLCLPMFHTLAVLSLLAILSFTCQKQNHWSTPPQKLPYHN